MAIGLAEEEDPRYETVWIPSPKRSLKIAIATRRSSAVAATEYRRYCDEPREGRRGTRGAAPSWRQRPAGGGGDIQVHLVIPKSFNDAQQIADQFKDAIPVILNLQGTDTSLNALIDFASGLDVGAWTADATDRRQGVPRRPATWRSQPRGARLIEKGFFNQFVQVGARPRG